MEVVQPRCAGLDVSKRDVKVCVRIQGRGSRPTRATVTTWGSTTRQILALRDMLVEEGVGMVVIESTGTLLETVRAPRGAVESSGGEMTPPLACRGWLVKLGAARSWERA